MYPTLLTVKKKEKKKNKRRVLITLIKFFTDQTQSRSKGTIARKKGRKNKIPLVPPKLKLD